MDLVRCLATALAVRPGHEVKNPFLVALIHIAGTALNAAACKYCMCLDLVVIWYSFFVFRIFLCSVGVCVGEG